MDDNHSVYVGALYAPVHYAGVFGEYLSRLLDDRSEQAAYSVVFEKNSAVMVNQDRVNVLNDATAEESNLVQTGRDR